MTKRKTLLYLVARAAMTLLLAVAGITNASAAAHWVGNSAIFVNGTWYYAGTNLDWCTGGAFNDANLGTFINSIPLAGQSQNHEYGDVNWNGGSVTMYYKIDGGEQQSISLRWQSYNSETHNNLFESKDEYGNFVITSVDISGLSAGSHTIEVYYYCDNAWDSNNSQNYKAKFTVSAPTKTVNYIDENGETQSVEANVLANGSNTSDIDGGWYVSEGNVNFINTLSFTGPANLILADGADVTIDQYGETGIYANGNLNIYAQSLGNSKGSIKIGKPSYGIWANNVNINGGNIAISDCTGGIYAYTGDVYLNGGDVTIDCDNTGISAKLGSGIITLAGTSVTAKSYSGTVKVKSGLVYSDGTNNDIKANISDVSTIANKTLTLYGYSYIDENGDELTKTTNEVIVINSGNKPNPIGDSDNMDNDYWYVITGNNVVYDDEVYGYGNIHIILADDANITFNNAIQVSRSLTFYGQSNDTGTLNSSSYGYGINVSGDFTINGGTINANSADGYGISSDDIFINGGTINAKSENTHGIYVGNKFTIDGGTINAIGDYAGICTENDNIIINGGNVIATSTGNYCGAIFTYDNYVIINGGYIDATGVKYGIDCINGITIAGGTVTSSSYNGTVKVADGFIYSDGTNNELTGTINTSSYNSETTLSLIAANLTANSADGNYWSTFYFGSKGFTIDEGVNAFAYTATYGLNSETKEYEIMLHKLGEDGKSIPEGTAVIIVSSTASVRMTPNDNLGKFSGTNNLHGVDVATATSDITSELGQGTIFVLGMTTHNDEVLFGFHKYTGATMPARKAFLLINSNNENSNNEALARGISVVFDDDSTTGIKAVNREERIMNSDDAWFDLQGRKIQEPTQRGLYIHNGKKIVVK